MPAYTKPLHTQPDVDATKASAHLPGLDIEIVHRRSPSGDAEQLSINLQAVPSFEAFGRYLDTANPFAFWAQAMQMAWAPWLGVASAMMTGGGSVRQLTNAGAERSSARRAD